MRLDIYYSYACHDSYLVFDWLRAVHHNGQALDVNWRPFAIQNPPSPGEWSSTWETANSELRGFIAAEAARKQGLDAFQRFHTALEQAVHEGLLELGDETTLLGAAKHAGLDIHHFRSDWNDPCLLQNVRDDHAQAAKKLQVFGTPTLIFPNGHAYHLELSAIPKVQSLEVFRAIETLAVTHPFVRQFKRVNQTGE